MIRRYSLAVVGVLLMAALLSAIVRVAPWTQSIYGGRSLPKCSNNER